MSPLSHPIGVFDSGVGGLTVLRALTEALPHEDFIYLGDTARLPYGTKSAATVAQYALQAARLLIERDIKLLVVACNTATALALPNLREALPNLPCLGVIEPGARAAAEASSTGRIAVLATEGTARSGAYAAAIKRCRPGAEVQSLGCNLLVGLAEEGWCEGAEAEAVLARYLVQLKPGFDTLMLGCTHFPVFVPTLRALLPSGVRIVDTAAAAANSVAAYLAAHRMATEAAQPGDSTFLVTDLPERFGALVQRFLGVEATPAVTLVHPVPSFPFLS